MSPLADSKSLNDINDDNEYINVNNSINIIIVIDKKIDLKNF